jgi:hypothetical protein
MINFLYVPVLISERLPDLYEFVPVVDDAGEIIMYQRTEEGWNMRDAEGTNTPDNNRPLVYWLSKKYINFEKTEFRDKQKDLSFEVIYDHRDAGIVGYRELRSESLTKHENLWIVNAHDPSIRRVLGAAEILTTLK